MRPFFEMVERPERSSFEQYRTDKSCALYGTLQAAPDICHCLVVVTTKYGRHFRTISVFLTKDSKRMRTYSNVKRKHHVHWLWSAFSLESSAKCHKFLQHMLQQNCLPAIHARIREMNHFWCEMINN
ncbi:uncharacterized protein LOC124451824 [Xenia sp. Carnegie-2017]|uniref:uncharacterized protein LOC124451824 n=1 Tax=Xenia sp. Carnegie-2017 TaxID=2897299 RepID=UPI001F046233|nr:uncharacterized protein LOC124451824 [Xenia sp. Carnegie-2017]